MSDVHPTRIRFSGYRNDSGQARPFLPGHANLQPGSLTAEVLYPNQTGLQTLDVRRAPVGDSWETVNTVPAGTHYRFRHAGDSLLSAELQQRPSVASHGEFFQVPHNLNETPRRSTVIMDFFPDSLVDRERFDALKAQENGMLPLRNHFNLFGEPGGNEKGLREMLPHFREAGFTSLLFKPFIGGDKLSSHGYWTVDPYVLNNTFSSKQAFRTSLNDMLRHGMKIYADGAFVNQGLTGVQMLSNLVYGYRSPYWAWFKYGAEHQPMRVPQGGKADANNQLPNRWDYPPHAFDGRKIGLGVLPVKYDVSGHSTVDYSRFAVRLNNAPDSPKYDNSRPTYLELYDPRLEDKNGKPRPISAEERHRPDFMAHSNASVQHYQIPVSAEEYLAKLHEEQQWPSSMPDAERQARHQQLFSEWKNFRLTKPTQDDSSVKWDGNVDVALMNTKNPEVVSYLENAMAYWTRMVKNNYLNHIASGLSGSVSTRSGQHTPQSLLKGLEAITQKPNSQADLQNPKKILPPIMLPDVETATVEQMQAAIVRGQRQDVPPEKLGGVFAKRLLSEVPLSVLPLPNVFKGTLSLPALSRMLKAPEPSERSYWSRFIHTVFTPFLWLPGAIAVRNFLSPPPFEQQLGEFLQKQLLGKLPADQRAKMQHNAVQSVVADRVGEPILLSLLTGLNVEKLANGEASAKAIEDGFYHTVPAAITMADPLTGAEKLVPFLKKRLKAMEKAAAAGQHTSTGKVIQDALKPLDPTLLAVAETVLNHREYGLNWRIDAAKDVADMDAVRATADPAAKVKRFKEEMAFAKQFWQRMGNTVREIFPRSSIIAELTDLDKLSDKDTGDAVLSDLMTSNTFSGIPNMKFLYSQLMQLVNYAQRPDEYGGSQLKPSQFLKDAVHPIINNLPHTSVLQSQNLVSSHDYSTASHAMLVNPALFNTDLLQWWGLKDDFLVAAEELRGKTCFSPERQQLRTVGLNPPEVLNRLRSLVDKGDFPNRLDVLSRTSPDAADRLLFRHAVEFYDQNRKEAAMQDNRGKDDPTPFRVPTPAALKPQFIDAIFKALSPEERQAMGLTGNPEAETVLKQMLKSRIGEPSAAKGMRGVMVNAMESFTPDDPYGYGLGSPSSKAFWKDAQSRYGLDGAQLHQLKNALKQNFWHALNATIHGESPEKPGWESMFGYQPPDIALQHIFANMDSSWAAGTPLQDDAKRQSFARELQQQLYMEAYRPVLPKMLRLMAVQNALPGNPSVYLPDWFVQGGSEWTKNIYNQNRALIRVDKLQNAYMEKDPDFRQFNQAASAIFRTRSQGLSFPLKTGDGQSQTLVQGAGALNDGVLLDVPADDKHGVLPLVRDNGKEQVITLVYTGHPSALDWNQRAGRGSRYADIRTSETPLSNYRTRLTGKAFTPGAKYQDAIEPSKRYTLNVHGELLDQNGQGLTLKDARILVRCP